MSKEQVAPGVYKITPEQEAKLKKFGKKNGLSEQKVQSQLSPKPTVQQFKAKLQTAAQEPIITAPAPTPPPPPQLEQPEELEYEDTYRPSTEQRQTYYSYQDEKAGNLEIDLITFRERGVETRYLSLLFSGLDIRQQPPVPQQAYLNIESKEDFELLKAFFAQLEWED